MQFEGSLNEESQNPLMGGLYVTDLSSASENISKVRKRQSTQSTYKTSSSTNEIVIESKVPPSPRLMTLLSGLNVPGDSGNPPEPPPWLDRELFDQGREFYSKYLFALSFSEVLTLLLTFSIDRSLRPLIYTGQSDTPEKALKRYFSTLLHVITWYKGDVWDPEDDAFKDIMAIRSVHNKIAKLCNSSEEIEKVTRLEISERGHKEPSDPLYKYIQRDVLPQVESTVTVTNPDDPPYYISQLEMSMTQYGFMALMVTHPEKFGAGAATEEELAGLIHYWRGLGWLLGIEDKYNLCSGSVAETRALCLEIEKTFLLPYLSTADWNYEHMVTSLTSGLEFILPSSSFPTMFRYLAHTIGISIPSFIKRMSYKQTFYYWLLRLHFGVLWYFPSLVMTTSNKYREMIENLQDESSEGGTCPMGFVLKKNYS